MTLAQVAPKPATSTKIWEDASPLAAVGDIIRKPFCPIARVVGKEILKDGRTSLIVTFPNCLYHHSEEWVLEASSIPAATGTNNGDEPPNRGDNGRGRVQPISAKKLLPLIVPISRISSDISVSNFDRNELEILGELSLVLGGFLVPPVLVRHSGGYKVVSGHLQYHAAVLAKQLNPRAGENIPAIVLEEENQAAALSQLKRLKFAT